jgi:hypothetical protein
MRCHRIVALAVIGAGTRRAVAGDTARVAAGTYPEQASFPNSGEADAPLTVLGAPGTVVSGANAATGAPGARITPRDSLQLPTPPRMRASDDTR